LFELPDQSLGLYTPLLLLRHPDYQVALLVEKVSDILTVAEEAVLPIRENHTFNDCVEGMITIKDRVILLLSAERILLEKEQQCLLPGPVATWPTWRGRAGYPDRRPHHRRDLLFPAPRAF